MSSKFNQASSKQRVNSCSESDRIDKKTLFGLMGTHVNDCINLFAAEFKLAASSFAVLWMLSLVVAILGLVSWLSLCLLGGALLVSLTNAGWVLAAFCIFLLNAVLMLTLLFYMKQLKRNMSFNKSRDLFSKVAEAG